MLVYKPESGKYELFYTMKEILSRRLISDIFQIVLTNAEEASTVQVNSFLFDEKY